MRTGRLDHILTERIDHMQIKVVVKWWLCRRPTTQTCSRLPELWGVALYYVHAAQETYKTSFVALCLELYVCLGS